nr:MAG TPA: hypothetical protein [Caudoviricetes sp.]
MRNHSLINRVNYSLSILLPILYNNYFVLSIDKTTKIIINCTK